MAPGRHNHLCRCRRRASLPSSKNELAHLKQILERYTDVLHAARSVSLVSVIRHTHCRTLVRLHPHRHLLRLRHRRRTHRPVQGRHGGRLPHLWPFPAGLGDRYRLRLGEPRRGRDHGNVRQWRRVRHADLPLLLDRRGPGHDLPGTGHDALLLRLQGALGTRVHAQALRHRCPPGQRAQLRPGPAAHRRHQPVPAGQDHELAAGLAPVGGTHRRRSHRLLLQGSPRRSTTRSSSSSSSWPRCCP